MDEKDQQEPKPRPERPPKPKPEIPPLREPTDLQPATKARDKERETRREE